jgi:hypothetical protein
MSKQTKPKKLDRLIEGGSNPLGPLDKYVDR